MIRSEFDKLLIDEAIKQGVEVSFNTEAKNIDFQKDFVLTTLSNGEVVKSKFIVDASGYSRVLPTLLGLEVKSHLSEKRPISLILQIISQSHYMIEIKF